MNIYVLDFYMHGEKISKTCRYIVIDSGKRTLLIIEGRGEGRRIYRLTLGDHIVHANTSIHHLPHLLLRPSESGITHNTNQDCSTPNALSACFCQLSCREVK
jgi:hypothetical protein